MSTATESEPRGGGWSGSPPVVQSSVMSEVLLAWRARGRGFEPVAIAFEGNVFGCGGRADDHGGCDDLVAEDFAPAPDGFVAGHDQIGGS
jgi:hypothetical protein